MKKIVLILFALLINTTLFAHEDWVDVSTYYPAVGDTISIYLSAGHHYPKSEIQLAERLIYEPQIITPDGSVEMLQFTPEKNRWETSYVIKNAGVYVAKFALKKPQIDVPLFYGKAIIIAGGEDRQEKYSAQLPLEISPLTEISATTSGSTLKLHLLKNGEPATGTIIVMPAGSKNYYLTNTSTQPAEYRVKSPGKYLVYTEKSGTNCSVTFAIPE